MSNPLCLAVLGLVGALLCVAPAAADQAWLGLVSGGVEVGRGQPPVFRAATSGEALAPGDEIRTGRDGRVELVWQGSTIRLYGDSVLRLPESQGGVSLDRGNGLFDVLKRVGESFDVETPEVVVSVKGTRFGVELDAGAAAVSVYRGEVGVRALAATLENEVRVREGFRAVGSGAGPAELFLLHGPGDPWKTWGPNALPRSAHARATDASTHLAALENAKALARRTYQREALAQAAAKDPELARSVARLERLKAEKRRELGDGRQAPASPGDTPGPLPAKRDPIADADFAKIEQRMLTIFINRWANGGLPNSPTAATAGNWNITPEGNGDVKVREADIGQEWVFTPDELKLILLGNAPLPTSLASNLALSGFTEPKEFIQMLLVMAKNTQ
jgi:ferric-dicitrate binding protein FerR (iron transport regulator)